MKKIILFLIVLVNIGFSQSILKQNSDRSPYNVVWDSPSQDFTGSMPIGNGDIGLNIWVEKNGDVLFLIGKTDAFDENSTLLKLGRIRVRFTPNPFSTNTFFRQTLHLNQSEISIQEGQWLNIRIWIDANHPVIHVETTGQQQYQQEVFLETWRDTIKIMKDTQVGDLFKNLNGPDPYTTPVYPDQYEKSKNQLLWYHHNQKPLNDGYEINLKLQGLDDFLPQKIHPLVNRIFSAVVEGENFIAENEKKLVSVKKNNKFKFSIYALTRHPATVAEWKNKLDNIIRSYQQIKPEDARKNHLNWWKNFWNRS